MRFYLFSTDQWGNESHESFFSREAAEKGAVKLLRQGHVRVQVENGLGQTVMVLTQAQLHLFKDWVVE